MPPTRNPVPVHQEYQPRLPFDAEFQKALIRLLCEDHNFSHVMADHLSPQFFENEVLAWAFSFCQRYRESYHTFPSVRVLRQQCATLDSRIRPMYETAMEQIQNSVLQDEQWMRDQTLDFVKRSIFVRTYQETRQLYNSGKVEEAYDLMMQRMEQVTRTSWEPADEEDYFDELARRHNARMDMDPMRATVGTGFPTLDRVLGGGLSRGEAGCWIGYAKQGKSTLLINHGLAATMLELRQTAHFILEGNREQLANRYDAAFMDEFYRDIKVGVADADKYTRAWQQSQALRGLMKLRGFTDEWDYNITDVTNALRDWKRSGWVPEVIILDYGDLLNGREKKYPNEREKQKAAFRDIKSLANRGYVVWTASQAQRPAEGSEDKDHKLFARQIADCYEKVRVLDYLGSINATRQEKRDCRARLYAELYRDNAADWTIPIVFDGPKYRLREPAQIGWQEQQQVSQNGQPQQMQVSV